MGTEVTEKTFWKLTDLQVGDLFMLKRTRFVIMAFEREESIFGSSVDKGDLEGAVEPFRVHVVELGTGKSFYIPGHFEVQPIELITRPIK